MADPTTNIWEVVGELLERARVGDLPHGPLPGLVWRQVRADARRWAEAIADHEKFTVTTDERAALEAIAELGAEELEDPATAAYATAWGIDDACWPAFTRLWLAGRASTFELEAGAHYPVDDIDWPQDRRTLTSRPSNLHVRAGELPHVRVHTADGVRVTFDQSARRELTSSLEALRVVAGIHAADSNDATAYFQAGRVWSADVRERSLHMLAAACQEASVVVVPEWCVDEPLIDALHDATPPGVLVVAGSRILPTDRGAVNRATWWVGEVRFDHDKFAPARFEVDYCDVAPAEPHLTVYVADGWRVVVLVCKDALNYDVTGALVRVGATLVLVPSWTEKADGFLSVCTDVATHAQGVTVVAFGPQPDPFPLGFVGRPFSGHVCDEVAGARPGWWACSLEPGLPNYFAGT